MFSAVQVRAVISQQWGALKFQKPQIFLVELGGSGPWEYLASDLTCPVVVFFFWRVLLLIAKTKRGVFALVCVCVCACRCLMCLILDVNWPHLSLFHSRGSRKRSSLRFLRAWWLSWTKTSTVLTTTWLRSVHAWLLHSVHRRRGLS